MGTKVFINCGKGNTGDSRNLSITSKPSNGTTEVIVISDSDDDEPQVVIKEPKFSSPIEVIVLWDSDGPDVGLTEAKFLFATKMTTFVPNNVFLRGILLHYFNMKKKAAESHRILIDEERPGEPPRFEDKELEARLDKDQTQKELAKTLGVTQPAIFNHLKEVGMIRKKQDTRRRKPTANGPSQLNGLVKGDSSKLNECQKWFARFKSGNFDLGEHKKRTAALPKFEDEELEASLDEYPTQTQKELVKTLGVTQPTIFHRLKEMGMIRKVGKWVLYELKPRDVERRFFIHNKVILQHDNAWPHAVAPVKMYLEMFKWEVLPYPSYSPDIAPSDYYLF
ncbi:SETMAR [Cordylochernes scorpioides]|uniref:SETMAR n=1 Tax=Cordylochernes scorpioides TaxID=51811 RepID=A0ABY6K7J5_9ARAC|nr:SETMAR [Cordylochernes scorpioides]